MPGYYERPGRYYSSPARRPGKKTEKPSRLLSLWECSLTAALPGEAARQRRPFPRAAGRAKARHSLRHEKSYPAKMGGRVTRWTVGGGPGHPFFARVHFLA